ncbi:hypothetical protein K458DRAFT_389980 [Lentithecium fluviatile CBS 122367]|uniref:Uncharacterized protein n=1 Tax=Lentithecium fluviatile CBS 122367 TaxID=1168545 RepID=A0A6G1IYN8_9PLEO|nr:hypothetical protein K458DRAFT_389980 [Lentithecium fluviatile CBS 122367]
MYTEIQSFDLAESPGGASRKAASSWLERLHLGTVHVLQVCQQTRQKSSRQLTFTTAKSEQLKAAHLGLTFGIDPLDSILSQQMPEQPHSRSREQPFQWHRQWSRSVTPQQDWPKHRITCKKISKDANDAELDKIVKRAGNIVQKAYLKVRENLFDTPIYRVNEYGDRLVIYDGVQKDKKGHFFAFPRHLFKSEAAEMGVLTARTCN